MGFDPNAAAAEGSGIFGLPHSAAEAKVVLIPVPFEATTSYGRGTAGGPAAMLAASRQIDLYDVETGRPYEAGIAMLEPEPEIVRLNAEAIAAIDRDRSDTSPVDAAGRAVLERVRAVAETHLAAGKLVGVVGGDHSVPLGAILATAAREGPFGILHIDAHADLRAAYEGFEHSHASIMHNVLERSSELSLTQVAIRDLCEAERRRIDTDHRISTFFDADLARDRLQGRLHARFDDIVATLPEKVYVSFDIDGLDPRFCPSTGTPVPGGLDFAEASILLERVARSRRIVGFDLTEVGPNEWDANVGARVLYKLIGWALASQG